MKLLKWIVPVVLMSASLSAQQAPQGGGGQFVATLGQAFAGPVGGGDSASTMVTLTNRDLEDCVVGVLFSQGAGPVAPVVQLNGQTTSSMDVTIPSGGARMVTLTAEELVQGILSIFAVNPCTAASISVSGSYTILGPTGGVREVFTLRPNGPDTWLRPGRCNVVTANQNPNGVDGPIENLGIATSSVVPQVPVSSGTELQLFLFNQDGERIDQTTIPISGEHNASFPIPANRTGKLTIVFCLQGPSSPTEIDLTLVKLVQSENFQFDNAIFADGFESGDVSAWSVTVP